MKLDLSRARRHLRLIILVALLEWLAIGVSLALITVTTRTDIAVSSQVVECSHIVAAPLLMGQSVSYDCAVVPGGWAQTSIAAKNNTALTIYFTPENGTKETVYTSTGLHFNALIPGLSAGTFSFRVQNMGASGNVVSGLVSVSQTTKSIAVVPSPKHPYREAGLVVLIVVAIVTAYVLYDPGRRLAGLSGRTEEAN
jgi:hypothetical protein